MKNNRVGRVTGVDIQYDRDAIFVDVALSPRENYDGIRYTSPSVGAWFVPSEGDIVEVERVGGRMTAHTPYNVPSYGLPDGLSEGDIAFRLNDSTLLHFEETDSGYDVTLKCDGDMFLDATTVYVGDSDNSQKLAVADHTHDFTNANGNTDTTQTENQDPTSNEME